MANNEYDCIVIGGGIGGAAATLRAAQYHLKTLWVKGTRKTAKASRGKYVLNIDNMIGVHPGIMLNQVKKTLAADQFQEAVAQLNQETFHIGTQEIIDNVIERIEKQFAEWVTFADQKAVEIKKAGDIFTILLQEKPDSQQLQEVTTDSVILSTGVMDRLPEVKKTIKSGREVDDIKWVFPFSNLERLLYCIRCEGHLVSRGAAVIIGYSEVACQVGLMLKERYNVPITMVTNGELLQAAQTTRKLMDHHGIAVETSRIVGFDDQQEGEEPVKKKAGSDLHAILLEDNTRVTARYGLVSLGLHRVYNELAIQLGAQLEKSDDPDNVKRVLVDDYSAETNIPGLFCVGDMATRKDGGPSMMQIYTAQEYAVRAIDTVDRRLRKVQRAAILGKN
ncbi:MAG: FAD-dependent oxidoreductase [Magnetococcales bacterium]|nr:FAD-dependent oxidoreductase [Magnetococcales bacterium]